MNLFYISKQTFALLLFYLLFHQTFQLPAHEITQWHDAQSAYVYQVFPYQENQFLINQRNHFSVIHANGSLERFVETPSNTTFIPVKDPIKNYKYFYTITDSVLYEFHLSKERTENKFIPVVKGLDIQLNFTRHQSSNDGQTLLFFDKFHKKLQVLLIKENFRLLDIPTHDQIIEVAKLHPTLPLVLIINAQNQIILYDFKANSELFSQQLPQTDGAGNFSDQGNYFFFDTLQTIQIIKINALLQKQLRPPHGATENKTKEQVELPTGFNTEQIFLFEQNDILAYASSLTKEVVIQKYSTGDIIKRIEIDPYAKLFFSNDNSRMLSVIDKEGDLPQLQLFDISGSVSDKETLKEAKFSAGIFSSFPQSYTFGLWIFLSMAAIGAMIARLGQRFTLVKKMAKNLAMASLLASLSWLVLLLYHFITYEYHFRPVPFLKPFLNQSYGLSLGIFFILFISLTVIESLQYRRRESLL